jgi:[acyl-carrier-protein] S-malonyltransferase
LDREAVEAICRRAAATGVCVPVNYNAPGQIVISGEPGAIERASELAKEAGARMVMPLPVSGAFHSPLMATAAAEFAAEVDAAAFRDPRVPTVSNASGRLIRTADEVRIALREQMVSPVRWEESVHAMVAAGVTVFIELGPGKVLSGLVRRIEPAATVANIEDAASLETALQVQGARE